MVYRRLPVGAEVQPEGGVHFRVWAPRSKTVWVEMSENPQPCGSATWKEGLAAEGDGYFSALVPDAVAGRLYRYRLDTGCFPARSAKCSTPKRRCIAQDRSAWVKTAE